MKGIFKTAALIAAGVVLTAGQLFAAGDGEIRGSLVSVNSHKSDIILKTQVLNLSGHEKREVSFPLSSNIRWTVCLNGQCAEKTGSEGYRLIDEYASYEALGISSRGANAILSQSGNVVTNVRVNLR